MDQTTHAEAGASQRQPAFPPARLAVSAMFLMNGFTVGSWAPKIPEFAARLQISEATLGLMILFFGIGSLVLMPVAGMLIARHGSNVVVKITAFVLSFLLLLLTFSNHIWLAAAAMFLFGGFVGAMDVAINANAVAVEKAMRRAVMSSCHAFWSFGGLLGAASGGFLLEATGPLGHALFATVVSLALLAICWRPLLADRPPPAQAGEKTRLPLTPLPWLVGLVALFSMIPEGTVLDWGALYLRQELGASVATSGFAFAAFSATMAIMRFAGDHVRDRFGAVRTLRAFTLTALVGMLVAGSAPNVPIAILGFAIAGIGISNMVPIAFSAGGNLPGLAPSIGLSVVTFMGYSGMLFAPSTIGFVAEHTGFAPVFLAMPVLFIVVLALSGHARHADGISGH